MSEPVVPYPEYTAESFKPMMMCHLKDGRNIVYKVEDHPMIRKMFQDKILVKIDDFEFNPDMIFFFSAAPDELAIINQVPQHLENEIKAKWADYKAKLGIAPSRDALIDMALAAIEAYGQPPEQQPIPEEAPADPEPQPEPEQPAQP